MNVFPFKASFPNMDLIASPDTFFNSVRKKYPEYKHAGFFSSFPKKAIYIYRIEGVGCVTGIIGSNELTDVDDNKILGHEHTITDKEQTMMSLMLMRKAMIKPVLLAYQPKPAISDYLELFTTSNVPFFSIFINDQNEKHTLWAIETDEQIEEVKSLFSEYMPKVYIADGHHRAAITARLVKKSYLKDLDDDDHPGLLCAYFPFSELSVYDFSRIVDFSNIISGIAFIVGISKYFEMVAVRGPVKPDKKHQISMYLSNEWYLLTWKEEILLSYKSKSVILDVDLFNDFILEEVLKIEDIRNSTDIKYIGGIEGPEVFMNAVKGAQSAGFCFYPVSKEDVIKISDCGEVLPPKSTWFEPRMRNGMIIKEF